MIHVNFLTILLLILKLLYIIHFLQVPSRQLNLLEYQSKVLLENHGVTIQKFRILESAASALEASKSLGKTLYI